MESIFNLTASACIIRNNSASFILKGVMCRKYRMVSDPELKVKVQLYLSTELSTTALSNWFNESLSNYGKDEYDLKDVAQYILRCTSKLEADVLKAVITVGSSPVSYCLESTLQQ